MSADPSTGLRAEAVVDLAAIRANTAALLDRARRNRPGAALMAVVKADGYGHGAVPTARAAVAGGATMLGLATPGEAVALRAAGIDAPLVAWLWVPDQDLGPALRAGVELVVSSLQQLAAVLRPGCGVPRVHLKVDTGLGRGGVPAAGFEELARAAAEAHRHGRLQVVGLMSHLANGDLPDDPSVPRQLDLFVRADAVLAAAGVGPYLRHLSNTPGVLLYPQASLDLVRCGIGIYGIDPTADGASEVRLRPAMTLRARVALVKRVPAGQGVSYGLTYHTATDTTLALVPVGYADGIPRAAGNAAEVLLGGRRRRIAGRVAMDQFVLDCGSDPVTAGDEVLIFGPGDRGEPTANEFAAACGTIGYEIVTRIGPRIPRRHLGLGPVNGPVEDESVDHRSPGPGSVRTRTGEPT